MRPIAIMILPSIFLLILGTNVYGQYEDYDNEHIESSLPNFSGFHTNAEYYRFNEQERAVYLLINGNLEFGNSDYVNVELIGTRYRIDGSTHYSAGDFSISYTKNFYSRHFLDSGFQGVSPSLKVILPTGNADYTGLFGYWIVEPSLYYSWLLKNEKFFVSNRWRMFLPLIDVRDAGEPPEFLRFEPRFGYEDNRLWTSLTLDARVIFNQDEVVLFYRLDGGLKINDSSGLSAFYTERVVSSALFKVYAGIGYYYLF